MYKRQLLDEPTPFLPAAGVAKLFTLIRSIAKMGSGVIFISHDIDEVMQITDRVTVLRDGAVAGELKTATASHAQIVEMIVGRELARLPPVSHAKRIERPVFARFNNVSANRLKPANIVIGRGEILGLTGLIGSGYEEIPYLVYGARPCRSGSLSLGNDPGMPLADMTPRRAMDLGFALLPGDRQGASGVDSLPIVDNMFLPDIGRFFRGGRMRNTAMVKEARDLGAAFEVRPNDPHLRLSALSGGNAQKVLVARWMNRKPALLLLDEPTQGVDVGTRQQIFSTLKAAADKGASVICASSDADQLAEICDRVLIFAKGEICAELTGANLTKDHITEACYASMSLGVADTPNSSMQAAS